MCSKGGPKSEKISPTLIFQALDLSFWLSKCQQNMRAYRITNLATLQLVHTLTDTLKIKLFLRMSWGHPPNLTPSIPNHPFTFLPSAKNGGWKKWICWYINKRALFVLAGPFSPLIDLIQIHLASWTKFSYSSRTLRALGAVRLYYPHQAGTLGNSVFRT